MEFRAVISLTNDAMLTGDDLAAALDNIAAMFRGSFESHSDMRRKVYDRNGNAVGHYTIDEEE